MDDRKFYFIHSEGHAGLVHSLLPSARPAFVQPQRSFFCAHLSAFAAICCPIPLSHCPPVHASACHPCIYLLNYGFALPPWAGESRQRKQPVSKEELWLVSESRVQCSMPLMLIDNRQQEHCRYISVCICGSSFVGVNIYRV